MRRYAKGIVKASRDDLLARTRGSKRGQLDNMSRMCRVQASAAGRASGGTEFGKNFGVHLDGGESATDQEFQRLSLMMVEEALNVSRRRRHPRTYEVEVIVARRRYPDTFEHTLGAQMSPNFLVTRGYMGFFDTGTVTGIIGLKQFASYWDTVISPARHTGRGSSSCVARASAARPPPCSAQ